MKHTHCTRPSLEHLEDRCCPSLTILFDGNNLTIGDGATNGAPAGGQLSLTQNAGSVSVGDNGNTTNLGTYAVTGAINVRLNNVPATVSVSLGANSTSGDLSLSLGNGGNGVTVSGSGGAIEGNFNVTSGTGNDTVNLS